MPRNMSPTSKTVKKSTGKRASANKKPRPELDLRRQLKIQKALYEIADAASAVTDMQSFYKKLHAIVGKLMYAKNFFIALYDEQSDLITWPYYVDTVDIEQPEPVRLKDQHGGTAWILKHGKTLAHIDGSVSTALERGEAEQVGTVSDAIGVPLKSDGKTKGVLLVQSYKNENIYTAQDLDVLTFVGQHIAIALTRARAIEEIRQRNQEIAEALEQQIATSEILGVIASSPTELQPVLDVIAERAAKICDTGACQIRLIEGDYLVVASNYGDDRQFPVGSLVSISRQTVSGRAVIDREMIHIPDLFEVFDEYPIIADRAKRTGDEAWLVAPLLREGIAIGTIHIRSFQVRPFTEKQMSQLKIFADQAVIAIENVRLFSETQRLLMETEQRAAELAIINSVQEGLASRLDTQAIYDLVGDKMREIFDAQGMTIATYDPAANLLHYRYSIQEGERIDYEPTPLSDKGFRAYIIRTHRPLRLDDVETQSADYGSFKLQPANTPVTSKSDAPKSWLGVPLLVGNEVRGVVNLYNVDRANAYSDSDLRLLETLTNSMSVALENARLWEQEKMYRKALQRELEIGREIQAGFLPEQLPLVEGWEIAASLMSAREVAGDFYDAFELPDGTIGLVIADVCDKGVGAALFMTLFRSLIRAAANLEYFQHIQEANVSRTASARLGRALSLTNNYIAETHGESGMFATIFFGILDPRDGKLIYINGGHEPPFILRSGNERETLHKTGPAVGAITNACFDILETQLEAGDIFFAFTDGVPDCKDPRGEFFGRERLLATLHRESSSSHGLVKKIELELRQYIAGTTQFDDITLLAVMRA